MHEYIRFHVKSSPFESLILNYVSPVNFSEDDKTEVSQYPFIRNASL
jgi:hypothetical protein